MIEKLSKANKAELEAEVALYREFPGVEIAAEADLNTNAKLIEEIEKLRAQHGYPVSLTDEFVAENPTLSKILIEAGAAAGSTVLAELADLDQAKELDTEAAVRTELLAELKELGVEPVEPETKTTAELEEKLAEAKKKKQDALTPQVQGSAPYKPEVAMDFAVNLPKLDRAQKEVKAKDSTLQGDAYVAAVKARYVEIGGLLKDEKPAASVGGAE